VDPATFFDVLPEVLDAARPLPGEEALYALVRSVLDAAGADRALRKALKEAANEADETLVKPLLEFRNFGIPLPDNWTTVINSAEFGTDYYTRTAVAKSNILINPAARDALFLSGPRPEGRAPHRRRALHRDLQGDAPGSTASGRSPFITSIISLRRTTSTASRSAPRTKGFATKPTARSSFMCRTSGPTRTRCRTGCLRRPRSSPCSSALIRRLRKFRRGTGRPRPWSRSSFRRPASPLLCQQQSKLRHTGESRYPEPLASSRSPLDPGFRRDDVVMAKH
jgi:hypothetical protein